jgi:L-alanine-DL-glutamate epimerase-like enolase superfamily enzyme
MKITAIEVRHFSMPLDPPFVAAWDPVPRKSFDATLTVVHTDAGLTGVGSGDAMVGFEAHAHLFIGQDPLAIERHYQVLDQLNFHYSRYWPLDLALWDLKGKTCGQPVHKLLGASSGRIAAYASTGEMQSAERRAASARSLLASGFKALKIRFHHTKPNADIAVVAAVRKAVGDDVAIMVDANQGWRMPGDTTPAWNLETALKVAHALEPYNIYWLEEPLPWDAAEEMATLRKMTGIRIAGGEMNRNRFDFESLSRAKALDVYQPDVALCGGITGVAKIAQQVQASGAWFSPHTWTNGIGVLANLHLACVVSRCPFVEFPYDPPGWSVQRRDFLQAEPLMIGSDGFVTLSDAPGLGFELNLDALARYEVPSL